MGGIGATPAGVINGVDQTQGLPRPSDGDRGTFLGWVEGVQISFCARCAAVTQA